MDVDSITGILSRSRAVPVPQCRFVSCPFRRSQSHDDLSMYLKPFVFRPQTGQSPSPPLVSVEPRYVEAQLGQSIDVRCTAQGFPAPSIQWLSAREILVTILVPNQLVRVLDLRKTTLSLSIQRSRRPTEFSKSPRSANRTKESIPALPAILPGPALDESTFTFDQVRSTTRNGFPISVDFYYYYYYYYYYFLFLQMRLHLRLRIPSRW